MLRLQKIWWFTMCVGYAVCLSENDLIPFKTGADDKLIPAADDYYVSVDLPTSFKFLGVNYSSTVYVNTNGHISFLGGIVDTTPQPWSASTPPRIAIYWADINTREGGEIWYKNSSSPSVLDTIKQDIIQAFPEEQAFTGVTALVTTWYDVAFYGANTAGRQLRNTFQCVLTAGDNKTFVIFNYVKLQWAGMGNPTTGLGLSAQVGFSNGSVTGSYSIEGAMTDGIKNLVTRSNVDIPGKFVFRVDESVVEPINVTHSTGKKRFR